MFTRSVESKHSVSTGIDRSSLAPSKASSDGMSKHVRGASARQHVGTRHPAQATDGASTPRAPRDRRAPAGDGEPAPTACQTPAFGTNAVRYQPADLHHAADQAYVALGQARGQQTAHQQASKPPATTHAAARGQRRFATDVGRGLLVGSWASVTHAVDVLSGMLDCLLSFGVLSASP